MSKENNFAFIDSNNLYQSLSKDISKNEKALFGTNPLENFFVMI